jgi:non-specific serine/threonine protein kinase
MANQLENPLDSKGMTMMMPVLTPHGVLTLRRDVETSSLEPARRDRLERAFHRGSGHGLLALGADEVGTALPTELAYWRGFGARYVTALCALPDLGEGAAKPALPTPTEGDGQPHRFHHRQPEREER